MRFSKETKAQKNARLSEWHRYFALLPVDVGGGRKVWFETVERRGEQYVGVCYEAYGAMPVEAWRWEYRCLS